MCLPAFGAYGRAATQGRPYITHPTHRCLL
jgi:hypothetical protein